MQEKTASLLSGPLEDVVAGLIAARETNGYRPSYVRSLRQYLTKFAKKFPGRQVDTITTAEIEAWFDARGEALSAKKANLGRLSALFEFAIRKSLASENPTKKIEPPRLTAKTPSILTVDQARLALDWTRRERIDCLPFLALALFAGVRPQELEKIGWQNIAGDRLTVDAETSKTRHRRIATVPDNALEWLRIARDFGRLPLPHQTRKRYLKRLRRALGLAAWPQDILRHTAASYLCATHGSRITAEWLGNSESILFRHYRELVSKESAIEFFNLKP